MHDWRYAVRTLTRDPAFAVVAVVTLALGIAASTSVFSILNAVLLRDLPYPNSDRLVTFREYTPERNRVGPYHFSRWRSQNQIFAEVAALDTIPADVTGPPNPERVSASRIAGDLFGILGVRPLLGRTFTSEEERNQELPVAIISHALWQRRYGGDPATIGRSLIVNGRPVEIVGVMPPGFWSPGDRSYNPYIHIWLPLAIPEQMVADPRYHQFEAYARLQPGVTLRQAQAMLDSVSQQTALAFPELCQGCSARVIDLKESVVGDRRGALFLVMGAAGLLCLIACANLAGLLLVRRTTGRRDNAIRAALGATGWILARQWFLQVVILGVLSSVAGLLLAAWIIQVVPALTPGLPRINEVSIDGRVVMFALVASVLTALLAGAAPIWQNRKTNLYMAMRPERTRLHDVVVVSQVALTFILLAGTTLMTRTFLNLQSVDLGYRGEGAVTLRVVPLRSKHSTPEQRARYVERILGRVQALPGVETAGMVEGLPMMNLRRRGFSVEGRPATSPEELIQGVRRTVTPGYFRAMDIGLLRGRTLIQDDVSGAPLVAVVSQSLEPYFGDGNALGKRVKVGLPGSGNPWLTVVGVVGDVRESNLTGEIQPNIFVSYRQFAASRESPRELIVRSTAGDPMQLVPGIEDAVWAIDKDQAISNIQTLDTALYLETAEQRFQSALLFLFSVLGLGLAAVGIYGVVSYFVAQRRREIAIRIALGAQGRDTVRLVVGRSLALTAIGLVVGTAGAFAVARVFASMLYGVSPTDPLTLAISHLALLLVSITAAWLPARRALTVEPLAVLRHE